MACEEGVPAPAQSVISRVETFISGIQGYRDEDHNPEEKANPLRKDEEGTAKGGGEGREIATQPSEPHPQETGRQAPGRPRTKGQADLVIWMIWLFLMGGVHSYQMEYQDCRDPTRLERFMENTACTTEHTSGEQPGEKTYTVLTEAPT
ncbi:MAG: hypothetical protein GY696_05480 [Gammaproteobacteria bacterium]|nr:hypothetical protein [Gammaproteobacteria bacterium]